MPVRRFYPFIIVHKKRKSKFYAEINGKKRILSTASYPSPAGRKKKEEEIGGTDHKEASFWLNFYSKSEMSPINTFASREVLSKSISIVISFCPLLSSIFNTSHFGSYRDGN